VIGEHLPRWTPVAELTFVGSAISGFDGDRKLPPPRSEDEEVDPNGGGEHDQRT